MMVLLPLCIPLGLLGSAFDERRAWVHPQTSGIAAGDWTVVGQFDLEEFSDSTSSMPVPKHSEDPEGSIKFFLFCLWATIAAVIVIALVLARVPFVMAIIIFAFGALGLLPQSLYRVLMVYRAMRSGPPGPPPDPA